MPGRTRAGPYSLEDGQTLVVGRGQSSDTKINDPRMSRAHCRVVIEGGKATLIDAGGAGGTLVDEQPITGRELKPGDVFQAGETRIRCQLDSSLAATPRLAA